MSTPYAATLQCPGNLQMDNGSCSYLPVCNGNDNRTPSGMCMDPASRNEYAPACQQGDPIDPRGMCRSGIKPMLSCSNPRDTLRDGICYSPAALAPAVVVPPPAVAAPAPALPAVAAPAPGPALPDVGPPDVSTPPMDRR